MAARRRTSQPRNVAAPSRTDTDRDRVLEARIGRRLLIALPRPGLEYQLQILNLAELVIDREQGLDHVLDLARHSVELLERDTFQFAADLFVQAENGAEAAGRRETRVDLVVG